MSLHRLTIFTLAFGLSLPLTTSLSSIELSPGYTTYSTTSLPPSPLLISDQTLSDRRIELMGVSTQNYTAPELPEIYKQCVAYITEYEDCIKEIQKLENDMLAKRIDSIQYFNLIKLYEHKILSTNELVDSMNKCLKEIKRQPFPHYPSFSNRSRG